MTPAMDGLVTPGKIQASILDPDLWYILHRTSLTPKENLTRSHEKGDKGDNMVGRTRPELDDQGDADHLVN